MHPIFEFLRENDLVSRKSINVSLIDSLSATDIVELAEIIVNVTERNDPDSTQTTFTHSASTSLGGGRAACEGLDHRLQGVEELARFAVMYSDKVYIENFFSDYNHLSHYRGEDDLKISLYDDLQVLLALKPLLEKQYVEFFTPHEHWCRECLRAAFGADTKRKINRGLKQLSNQYLANTSASLVRLDESICEIEYNAPEPYLEHSMVISNEANYHKLHEVITSMPRVLSKIEKGNPVPLSQTVQKKLDLHYTFARKIVDSVSYGIMTSKLLNTSFLTDNSLDLSFLQSITSDPQKENRNLIAFKHLTSIVPFAADVSISDLIKIRRREEEAFIKYRRALNEAIDEFKSSKATFSEKDARALYSDVIAPRLTNLDQSVRIAKRDLGRKAYRSIIAVVGAISFGIYTGFIPTEMAEMAKVLGFTKVAIDIIDKLLPLGDAVDSIKNEDLYFLWKVKKLEK